jgi:DNA (cytosine-5)-methyltransferase 1
VSAYYNENDAFAAAWLRNLIAAGLIAPGDVDERSIVDVKPDDLRGYTQCHFFAGIGGWSVALRQAGWSDDRSVWTGSCPCQPFSAAGAGKAFNDERHLWPAWFSLISERAPATIFGEQVEAAIGWGWLDAVFADLEGQGYTCGASVLPASGVGAPHIRQRLWFVADANGGNASTEGLQRSGQHRQRAENDRALRVADATDGGRQQQPMERCAGKLAPAAGEKQLLEPSNNRASLGDMANAAGRGFGKFGDAPQSGCGRYDDGSIIPSALDNAADARCDDAREHVRGSSLLAARLIEPGPVGGFWHDAEWIACTDGKARPVGPGSFPLGHGIRNRAPKLRAYGNAIVPQAATQFIIAADGAINELR